MIKAKKGLLLSVFSLILALVITTSSTYAWFAMNSSVTAENMAITARADSSYLVIESAPSGTGSFNGKIGNISTPTLDLTSASPTAVLPVTYRNTAAEGQTESWAWQTNVGTSYNVGTAHGTYQTVSEGSLVTSGYAGVFSFVVGLNPYVSIQDATNLVVSSITLSDSGNSNLFPALSVLVRAQVGSGTPVDDLYLGTDNTRRESFTPSGDALAASINHDGTPINITVFVFINGDNPVVTTEHTQTADLTTFTVSVGFSCTPPTQNA